MELDKGIAQDLKNAVADAIMDGAQDIAVESRRQVPVKTGALKDGCKVVRQDSLLVTVEYDLPYAVKVHEDIMSKHIDGKAKFLEDPFNLHAENIVSKAAENIKRVIE